MPPEGHSLTAAGRLSTSPSRRLRALLLDPLDELGEIARLYSLPEAFEAAGVEQEAADRFRRKSFIEARKESASGLVKLPLHVREATIAATQNILLPAATSSELGEALREDSKYRRSGVTSGSTGRESARMAARAQAQPLLSGTMWKTWKMRSANLHWPSTRW